MEAQGFICRFVILNTIDLKMDVYGKNSVDILEFFPFTRGYLTPYDYKSQSILNKTLKIK